MFLLIVEQAVITFFRDITILEQVPYMMALLWKLPPVTASISKFNDFVAKSAKGRIDRGPTSGDLFQYLVRFQKSLVPFTVTNEESSIAKTGTRTKGRPLHRFLRMLRYLLSQDQTQQRQFWVASSSTCWTTWRYIRVFKKRLTSSSLQTRLQNLSIPRNLLRCRT